MDSRPVQPQGGWVGQSAFVHQPRQRPEAPVSQSLDALGQFVVNVAGLQHRQLAALEVALVDAALETPLASGQLSAYLRIHSKSLRGCGVCESNTHKIPQNCRGISFFQFTLKILPEKYAWVRSSSHRSSRGLP